MSLGLPLEGNVRHVFVGEDTAQIVVDWSIDGKGPNFTLEARQAISCAAALMDSGATLSTIIKGRQCDSPPDTDICAPRLGASRAFIAGKVFVKKLFFR
jgi:hypothetical protein